MLLLHWRPNCRMAGMRSASVSVTLQVMGRPLLAGAALFEIGRVAAGLLGVATDPEPILTGASIPAPCILSNTGSNGPALICVVDNRYARLKYCCILNIAILATDCICNEGRSTKVKRALRCDVFDKQHQWTVRVGMITVRLVILTGDEISPDLVLCRWQYHSQWLRTRVNLFLFVRQLFSSSHWVLTAAWGQWTSLLRLVPTSKLRLPRLWRLAQPLRLVIIRESCSQPQDLSQHRRRQIWVTIGLSLIRVSLSRAHISHTLELATASFIWESFQRPDLQSLHGEGKETYFPQSITTQRFGDQQDWHDLLLRASLHITILKHGSHHGSLC